MEVMQLRCKLRFDGRVARPSYLAFPCCGRPIPFALFANAAVKKIGRWSLVIGLESRVANQQQIPPTPATAKPALTAIPDCAKAGAIREPWCWGPRPRNARDHILRDGGSPANIAANTTVVQGAAFPACGLRAEVPRKPV